MQNFFSDVLVLWRKHPPLVFFLIISAFTYVVNVYPYSMRPVVKIERRVEEKREERGEERVLISPPPRIYKSGSRLERGREIDS